MSVMMRRMWIQLTADRRRFGVLCAMLAVGMLLWARVIVVTNIPRTAVAEKESASVSAGDDQQHSENTSADRSMAQAVEIRLDSHPHRDPFVISTDYFPKLQFDEESGRELAKSRANPDDNGSAARLQQRLRYLQQHADTLKLEAVMTGMPLAVISGKTFRLGDTVPTRQGSVTFELVDVQSRSVVLESEGHHFELKLEQASR